MASPAEKALQLVRYLPRASLQNLVKNPYAKPKQVQKGKYRHEEAVNKSNRSRRRFWPVGYEGGRTPFYMKIPIENYYANYAQRRQYPPLTLHKLQMIIDGGAIDTTGPIDLASICNSQFYKMHPAHYHYGVHLTDEGANLFTSKVNIEVQYASEAVIAAVEKNGGTITTAYYDIKSVKALHNPLEFFKRGEPIPKRELPTEDAFEYYSNPKNRGYLADPKQIEIERKLLAQKYGYELPEVVEPEMTIKKDPRQVFYGLEPGWLVLLKEKTILRPTDKEYVEYYSN